MSKYAILDRLAIDEVKTQSDYLADKIKNMIASRELDERFSFPNENDFCKRLKVSRSTLREAYKILDTEGFIRRTKRGTFVKCKEEIARQGNFVASLRLAEEQELFEFVCALEPDAAALAAKKIDESGIAKLKSLMEECQAKAHNWKELLAKNYQFHAYIRERAGNNLITSALIAYYDIFNQQIITGIYAENEDIDEFRENSLKQHRELFEAIKHHDAEKAEEIAYQHLLDDIAFKEAKFN